MSIGFGHLAVQGHCLLVPSFSRGGRNVWPCKDRLRALVQVQVEEALMQWEPRIDVKEVSVSSPPQERNQLDISIEYEIRNNNAFHNLVYPFFLNESAA